MIEEIVKRKKYKRPQIIHCGSCPHCLQWFEYEDCERYYCLVEDEYKYNDVKQKDCPFNKEGK